MGRFKTIFFVFLLSLLVQFGCSNKSETAKIGLALPSWPTRASLNKTGDLTSFATADNLQVIIVNITGPGIPTPAFFFWDRHDNGGAPPSFVELTVARGENRLTQVLVVFEDPDTGTMEFHYGDKLQSFTADAATVPITIEALQSGTARNGRLAGRYLDSSGHGPTGMVSVKYVPPGKPPMLLFSGFIFAGWFEFFTLENIGLSYYLAPGGDVLFKDATSSSSALVTGGSSTARIVVPKYYYQNGGDSSAATSPRSVSAGAQSIVGYFGPGAGTKPVCYNNTITPMTGSYTTADLSNSTYLSWVGLRALDSIKAGIELGGELVGNCPTQENEYTNHLRIDSSQVTNGDGVLGFRGPFRLQSTGGSGSWKSPVLATTSGSGSSFSLSLNWKYMPDVFDSDGIGGVALYVRSGTASSNNRPDYESGDGIACGDDLEVLNFTYLQDVPATSLSGSATIPASIVSQTNYQEGKFQAILCPYLRNPIAGKRYPSSGAVDYRSYTYSGSSGPGTGGNSGPSLATRLIANKFESTGTQTTSSSRAQVMKDVCYPIRVFSADDQGSYGTMNGQTVNLTVTSPAGGELLYTDQNCTAGGTDTLSIPNFGGYYTVFIEVDESQNPTLSSANITFATTGSVSLTGTTFYASYSAYQPANKLITLAQDLVVAHSCFPIDFRSVLNTVPSAFSSVPVTFNITTAPSTSWEFYPNMTLCQTGAQTSFIYSAQQLEQHVVARYVGSDSGSMTILPTTTDSNWTANSATIEGKTVNVVQPGAPVSLAVPDLNSNIPAEQCQVIHVVLVDSNSYQTPLKDSWLANPSGSADSLTVNMTATNGTLSQSSCSDAGSSSLTISIPELSAFNTTPLYFKATAAGQAAAVTATVSTALASGISIAALNRTLTVSSPRASRIEVGMEGQSWNSTSKTFVGTPYGFVLGQTRTIQLVALTPSGLVDPTFNRNSQQIGLAGSQAVYTFPSSPLSFTAGTVSVPVTALAAQSLVKLMTGGGSSGLDQIYGPYHNIYVASAFRVIATNVGISRDACQPVLVQSIYSGQSLGPAVPIASATSVTVSVTSGNSSAMSIYQTPDCSSGGSLGSAAFGMAAGSTQFTAYVKTISTSGTYALQASASGFGSGSASLSAVPTSVGSGTELDIQANQNGIRRGMCEGFMVVRTDTSGSAVPGASLPVTLSTSYAPGTGTFYATPNCGGGAISVVTIPTGSSSAMFYYKHLGDGDTSISGSITASGSGVSSGTYSASGF